MQEKLFQLQTQHLITMEDAVVVERRQDGKVKLHQVRSTASSGALGGALWGGLGFFSPERAQRRWTWWIGG